MAPTQIEATMTIPEILEKYPQTLAVFERYGLKPQGYKALEYENLFASARVHHIELDTILTDLNQVVSG